jgi:hypothetical protein
MSAVALLEPEVAATVLGRAPDEIRISYVRYKPGRRLVVQYAVSGEAAVAIADARAGRGPTVGLQWLPVDAALPALALRGPELARRLRTNGVPASPTEPELLAYRPLRRAVLRLGRHVLKLYADGPAFVRARDGIALAASEPRLHAPALAGTVDDLWLVALEAVEGARLDDPLPRAAELGSLLRELHALDATGLRTLPVEATLSAAREAVAVLDAIAPETGRLAGAVLRRLASSAPTGLAPATCHADFEAGQVLVSPAGLTLLDFDDLAAAPPALDFAGCAAHLLRRPDARLDLARELVDGLADGYGVRPPALDWHLAVALVSGAPAPFRHAQPDWREVAARLVAAAGRIGSRGLERA